MAGRQRVRTFAAITLAALLAFAPVSAWAAPEDEPIRRTVTYEPDPTPDLPNPERGRNTVVSRLQTLTDHQVADAVDHRMTLIRAYVDLSGYVHADVLPEDLFLQLKVAFELLRKNGLKAILRFSYSPGGTKACGGPNHHHDDSSGVIDGPSDAPLDRITGHIRQVSAILHENVDVISSFEAGFLGEFGEWHCSTYNREDAGDVHSPIKEDARRHVLTEELKHFPAERQIALRYPRDVVALAPQYAESTSRIGNHQDCYASGTDDGDTWLPGERNEEMKQMRALGQWHVLSAVACSITDPANRVNCVDALREMPEMRFSYIDGQFWGPALEKYREQGCWDEIQASIGYRFELVDAEMPAEFVAGTTAHVRVRVHNAGWASPFNERPVHLTLSTDDRRVLSVVLPADPRAWKSGETVTVEADLPLPADLAPGDYSLGLWLPDAAESLKAESAFAIRFANENTWNPSLGTNRLAAVSVTGPPAPMPAPSGTSDSAALAESGAEPDVNRALALGAILVLLGILAVTWRRSRLGSPGPDRTSGR